MTAVCIIILSNIFHLAYFQMNNTVECINSLFLYIAEYPIVWIYHSLFIYLSVDMWIVSSFWLLDIKLNEYSRTCLSMVEFTSEAMWASSFLRERVFNNRFNFFSYRAIEVIFSRSFLLLCVQFALFLVS